MKERTNEQTNSSSFVKEYVGTLFPVVFFLFFFFFSFPLPSPKSEQILSLDIDVVLGIVDLRPITSLMLPDFRTIG